MLIGTLIGAVHDPNLPIDRQLSWHCPTGQINSVDILYFFKLYEDKTFTVEVITRRKYYIKVFVYEALHIVCREMLDRIVMYTQLILQDHKYSR